MTKEEFVEMLTIMHARSITGDVIAARTLEDVGADETERWGSLLVKSCGALYVDDSDDEREWHYDEYGNQLGKGTPLYALGEVDTWPEGLFEKLSGYIWWIDPEDEINPLDVIAATPKHLCPEWHGPSRAWSTA